MKIERDDIEFRQHGIEGFEDVRILTHEKSGLKAIIALHSTALGPAIGGCRSWSYSTFEEGMRDALRLSRGMSMKASAAGLDCGGGKSVIFAESKTSKSPELLAAFATAVHSLRGRYIAAKGIGINAEDLKLISEVTPYVVGVEGVDNRGSDPSVATARGVFNGIQSAVCQRFGSPSLAGRKIVIQGLGSVSNFLIRHLLSGGAKITGCDIDHERAEEVARYFSIETIHPAEV